MILLSHEQQCSLAPANDRHDADRLHALRRSESDRDLAYLIRTLLRFSAQRERGLSSRPHRRQPVARSQDLLQSAPTVPAAGSVVGSVVHVRWLRDQAQPQCDLVRTFGSSEINDPLAPSISTVFGASRDGAGARGAWDVGQGSLRGDITFGQRSNDRAAESSG